MQFKTYQDLMLDQFEKRKLINGTYSLRAFARDLGISAPRLSQVLAKKHGLSVSAAKEIAVKMRLGQEKEQWFCDQVGAKHSRNSKSKEEHSQRVKKYKKEAKEFSSMEMEYFKIISDWYHYAILELTYLDDFVNCPEWIANSLDISISEVTSAIARLKALDLIEERDGKLIDKFEFLTVKEVGPSNSLKKFHTQILKKAILALYEQPLDEREISSNVFAIRKQDMNEYKNKIKAFRLDLESRAKESPTNDAVYCLGIQFFELTRGKI